MVRDPSRCLTASSAAKPGPGPLWPRILLLAGLAATVGFLAWSFREQLSVDWAADRESMLLAFARRHTLLAVGGLFLAYVAVTATSIPAATVLTFVTAWLCQRIFGPVGGFAAAIAVVSFASAIGATLAFLFSRHLLRDAIHARYADRVARFDKGFAENGAFYLFTLRLTPLVPFWLVNLVMGLTPIRTRTFWLVSQVGMLPGTLLFVFSGSQVPSLSELESTGVGKLLWPGPFVALALLAFMPLVARRVVQRFGEGEDASHSPEGA